MALSPSPGFRDALWFGAVLVMFGDAATVAVVVVMSAGVSGWMESSQLSPTRTSKWPLSLIVRFSCRLAPTSAPRERGRS